MIRRAFVAIFFVFFAFFVKPNKVTAKEYQGRPLSHQKMEIKVRFPEGSSAKLKSLSRMIKTKIFQINKSIENEVPIPQKIEIEFYKNAYSFVFNSYENITKSGEILHPDLVVSTGLNIWNFIEPIHLRSIHHDDKLKMISKKNNKAFSKLTFEEILAPTIHEYGHALFAYNYRRRFAAPPEKFAKGFHSDEIDALDEFFADLFAIVVLDDLKGVTPYFKKLEIRDEIWQENQIRNYSAWETLPEDFKPTTFNTLYALTTKKILNFFEKKKRFRGQNKTGIKISQILDATFGNIEQRKLRELDDLSKEINFENWKDLNQQLYSEFEKLTEN